jgi:hypothetical protein
MTVMFIIGVPCLIIGIVLLVKYSLRKRSRRQPRRSTLIVSIILLVIAGVMIVPPDMMSTMIRISNDANNHDYVDTGKVAQEYGDDTDDEPLFDVTYIIFDGEKYTNLALSISDYGDVIVNLSAVKTAKPAANVVTEIDRSLFRRALSAIFGGRNETGTVNEVSGTERPPMLRWEESYIDTWSLYCPDVSLNEKLRQYSNDERYDYYYAILRSDAFYEYDGLDAALVSEKKSLTLERKYYRELTEGLRLAIVDANDETDSDEILLDDDIAYDDGELDYAELHIFSISDDELLIREHAVLLMKKGKLYQANIPGGFVEYSGPQFMPDDDDEYRFRGAPIPEDIGDAIIREVGKSVVERSDVSAHAK